MEDHPQFEVLQENVLLALRIVTKAISNKPQLPILSSLLLVVKDGQVMLAATDLYMGVKISLPAKTQGAMTVAVPGRILIETIAAMPPGKVTFALDKQTLTVTNTSVTTSLQCQNGEEYPEFPEFDGPESLFETSVLETVVAFVGLSAALDQARLVLTTLLFAPTKTGLEVVGTDGFRLSLLRLGVSQMKGIKHSLLVPAKPLAEVVAVARSSQIDEITLAVSTQQKQLLFKVGTTQLFVRLVEGEFPPYEKIIPNELLVEVVFDAQEFLTHIKQALVLAREASNVIQIEIGRDLLTLRSQATSRGTFTATMPLQAAKAGEMTFACNAKYLVDILSQVKTGAVRLSLLDPLKPVVLTQEGNEDFLYIIMPFRMSE